MTFLPEFKPIICDREGPIFRITLNRPERLNAFDGDMFNSLARAVEIASTEKDIRVVVFSAAGRVFSCGGDLRNVVDNSDSIDEDTLAQGMKYAQAVFDKVEEIPKPTIAAINGHAVGAGFQLTLTCDFRFAVNEAKLGVTDVKIGILPGLGATTRLPKLVGLAKAKELILSGDLITATEALEIGLVNRVVAGESLNREVQEFSKKLLNNAPLALEAAKSLLNSEASLDEVAIMQSHLIKSVDAGEGISAFLEKRTPRFKG